MLVWLSARVATSACAPPAITIRVERRGELSGVEPLCREWRKDVCLL